MSVLSLKFILALSCVSAFCLRAGVASCSAPACTQNTAHPGPHAPSGTLSDAVMAQLTRNILEGIRKELNLICNCKLGSVRHPATSCKDVYECDTTAPSGYYWINTTMGIYQVFCSAGGITDCYDAMMQGHNESGVYNVQPNNANNSFNVVCDMETDGGGWTVLLKRQDGSVDFYHNWTNCKNGFGSLKGEHWMGLENTYLLTKLSGDPPQLRVDLADWEGNTAFAKYNQFSVDDKDSGYTLYVSGYQPTSTAGDSFIPWHNGHMFSTPDRDNDASSSHCAVNYHGPWWYYDCYVSLLTGKYYTSGGPRNSLPFGINWNSWAYSYRVAEMKIRPGGV